MTFLESVQFNEILIVENSIADANPIMEAFEHLATKPTIRVVENIVNASDYLNKKSKYKDCKTPQLILLDSDLPMEESRKLIKEIKNDDKLRLIPVVIFSS